MLPWTHLSSHPKWHLNWFSRFCTAHGRDSLDFATDRPFPLKIVPLHGGSEPPSNACFLGPTRVHNQNGVSISSAVFARLVIMTDRQTDHDIPSVTIGRTYVRSTAMWPSNDDGREKKRRTSRVVSPMTQRGA